MFTPLEIQRNKLNSQRPPKGGLSLTGFTLGIETSCDETAVAIIRDEKDVLSNIVSSSVKLHSQFGGVVPEIATRFHVEYISYCIRKALDQANITIDRVGLVAVTYGPGLVGALLVGLSMAKSLSFSLGIPLIGVNHLMAHLYINMSDKTPPKYPFIGLVISGGHTSLVYMRDIDDYQILGQTQDDAVGEAFDKAAKILKLGYPGGPIIEKMSKLGNSMKVSFAKMRTDERFNFTFSGIKTALLYKTRDIRGSQNDIANMAASFQEAVVGTLIDKTLDACLYKKCKTLVVGGGVSANSYLKCKLTKSAKNLGIKVHFPDHGLSLDNAVMIATLGYEMFRRGKQSDINLAASPNLGLKNL